MVFEGGEVAFSTVDLPRLYASDNAYTQSYIDKLKDGLADYSAAAFVDYFQSAEFQDDLIVYLVPTDDDFQLIAGEIATQVDFRGARPLVHQKPSDELIAEFEAVETDNTRHLVIKTRKGALWPVIRDRLPWEDISIGFQCRIDRKPDVYNSDFWFHFTNVHIGKLLEPA